MNDQTITNSDPLIIDGSKGLKRQAHDQKVAETQAKDSNKYTGEKGEKWLAKEKRHAEKALDLKEKNKLRDQQNELQNLDTQARAQQRLGINVLTSDEVVSTMILTENEPDQAEVPSEAEQIDSQPYDEIEADMFSDQQPIEGQPVEEEEKTPEVKEELKTNEEIENRRTERGLTEENGWTQINDNEVMAVTRAIQEQTGSDAMPSAQQYEDFFNSHPIDANGHITDFSTQVPELAATTPVPEIGMPENNNSSSMNGYFVGFAAAAVIIYFIKKRTNIDEDTLFQRQKDPRASLMDYVKNPFNRRKPNDNDDFDEMI